MSREVCFITGNDKKFNEIKANLLWDIKLIQHDLDIPEIQTTSIEEISKDKALKAFAELKKPLIVDVMDNFFNSSWYFFRYLSAGDNKQIFDSELAKKRAPVDMYTGWNEHAVLHLMYTRFMTKFLNKIGVIDFDEPFKKFFAHWMI